MRQGQTTITRFEPDSLLWMEIHAGGASVTELAASILTGPGTEPDAGEEKYACRFSPDAWLLVNYSRTSLQQQIARHSGRVMVRLSDASGQFASFRIRTPSGSTPPPWEGIAPSSDGYAKTLLGGFEIVLWSAPDRVEIHVAHAFAGPLESWLRENVSRFHET